MDIENDEDLKKLTGLLSKESVSEDEAKDYGEELGTAIRFVFGCTGNRETIEYMLKTLSPDAIKRLRIVEAVIFLELAHDWRASDLDHWDERKQDSMRFAYAHEEMFKEQFKSLVGFELPALTDEVHRTYYLPSAIYRRPFWENNCSWIYYFILRWGEVHSTVKQNFCRDWVRTVLEAEHPNNGYGEVRFVHI